MDCPPSYMESIEGREAFRRIFCGLHNVARPDVPLGHCPQWSASTSEQSILSVTAETRFLGGYFLNTSSAIPEEAELSVESKDTRRQLIVPNVRFGSGTKTLASAGFTPIQAGDESIAYVGRDWEKEMRASHGSEALYEMRKSKRRTDSFSTLNVYRILDCPEPCLERLTRLLAAHEHRYGHTRHLFTRRYLDLIKEDDELSTKTYVAERISKAGDSIQAMIWIETENTLFYVTQASDRSNLDPKINVYKASYADVYQRANERGIAWANISRGNTELKRRLGATIQIPQFHWVRKADQYA